MTPDAATDAQCFFSAVLYGHDPRPRTPDPCDRVPPAAVRGRPRVRLLKLTISITRRAVFIVRRLLRLDPREDRGAGEQRKCCIAGHAVQHRSYVLPHAGRAPPLRARGVSRARTHRYLPRTLAHSRSALLSFRSRSPPSSSAWSEYTRTSPLMASRVHSLHNTFIELLSKSTGAVGSSECA